MKTESQKSSLVISGKLPVILNGDLGSGLQPFHRKWRHIKACRMGLQGKCEDHDDTRRGDFRPDWIKWTGVRVRLPR